MMNCFMYFDNPVFKKVKGVALHRRLHENCKLLKLHSKRKKKERKEKFETNETKILLFMKNRGVR